MNVLEPCDLLIEAGWVVPVVPKGAVLAGHAVAVRDGRILAVLPRAEARARFLPAETVSRPEAVLIPGLVNLHTHNPMTLLRGVADDLPLMPWLQEHIWPIEGAVMGPDFVADGIELAVAEMVRGGTTTCNESYFFPDVQAQTYQRLGFRATVGLPVIEFPSPWARTTAEYFDKALEVFDAWRGDPLVRFAFAPHAPYTVSDASFERIGMLSAQLDLPIHCHVHETAQEVEDSQKQHGQRPLARLDRLGIVDARLIAVHMTQLTEAEIRLCAGRGVHIAHCPQSNLKLASGFCPVEALRVAGANVGIGTDGCASNNDLDMFEETRNAALLAKAVAGDARALDAASALEAATLAGAKALGREHEIGSIEPGKQADLVLVDLGELELQPLYHVISHLVYVATRHQVSEVWIGGRPKLRERRLVGIDADALKAKARAWARRIATIPRSGATP
ncbi:MAG: TRZ/ATZ family hydrolase [Xanthomonadaceae bacterium]|nr:TRZ/ATZ family hydrolase [Xanthomonadaceae bacterium]